MGTYWHCSLGALTFASLVDQPGSHTPRDILLQKLPWYRVQGTVSNRQWRDVLRILAVQADLIDRRT